MSSTFRIPFQGPFVRNPKTPQIINYKFIIYNQIIKSQHQNPCWPKFVLKPLANELTTFVSQFHKQLYFSWCGHRFSFGCMASPLGKRAALAAIHFWYRRMNQYESMMYPHLCHSSTSSSLSRDPLQGSTEGSYWGVLTDFQEPEGGGRG